MTRSERRLFRDTTLLGALLTVMVVALDMAGVFAPAERFFYDFRARRFQYWTPEPTDRLVHLNIDDAALDTIGKFPWPREKLAEMVDEIRLAEAKTLAFDVIFAEASEMGHKEVDPRELPLLPSSPKTPDGKPIVYTVRVDHDDAFATALRRFGNVVIPVALNLSLIPPQTPVYESLIDLLRTEPALIEGEDIEGIKQDVVKRLRERGHMEKDLIKSVDDFLIGAAREGMFRRIEEELDRGDLTRDELRRRILPQLDATIGGSPLLRRMEKEQGRVLALRSLRRFARPARSDLKLLVAYDENATLRELSAAAALTGFVDYLPLADGVVRTVPLWVNHRGWTFPHIGLSLACAMLGIDIQKVEINPESIVLPCPDGRRITVPVRYHDVPDRGRYTAFLDVPWFGKPGLNEWLTMYDYPSHEQREQHLSLREVWSASELRQRIRHNNNNASQAIGILLGPLKKTDTSRKANLPARIESMGMPDLDQPDAYESIFKMIQPVMTEESWLPYLDEITKEDYDKLPDRDPEHLGIDKGTVDAYRAIKEVLIQNRGLREDLVRQRAKLRRELNGRACLVGYTAVGAIADNIPTSLHPRCPGVAVHGIIFNSIMTGDFWRPTPLWMRMLFVLIIGTMTTVAVATLPAWKALVAAVLIVGGYLVFNGFYLFDYKNLVVGVSGPVFAGAMVWAGGTLLRYVLETAERRRVQTKFSSYADRVLVDYVINNPNVKLDGQKKELSVVFTDLQGFTTLSEALGEKTVLMLNEYMGLMVPVIRDNHGYLNKFLGDGIMYFFGAPIENARHAQSAVRSVLEMQDVMRPYNHALVQRGLPTLVLRAGITTGEMVVGDAGPEERSDYTVLGDKVNLAARLEGANKATGTKILMNDRCREVIGDEFLCRPIAKLQVKGKTEGVMTFEALAFASRATDPMRQLSEMSAKIVHPFCAREFGQSLEAVEAMEKVLGPSKLTEIYREHCVAYMKEPPPEGWSGEIALSEK